MPKVGCVCGTVSFHVTGPLKAPDACHCTLCCKWSGYFFVSTDISKTAVTLQGADWLAWYLSSPKARSGFCSICGSTLFFEPLLLDWMAIAMGRFDGPTQTLLAAHIFVSRKGNYYQLSDGLPQNQT